MAQDDPPPTAEWPSADDPSGSPSPGPIPASQKSFLQRAGGAIEAFHDRNRIVILVASLASFSIITRALFFAGDYTNPERILTRGTCLVVQDLSVSKEVVLVNCIKRHNAEVMWQGALTDVTAEASAAVIDEQAERQCTDQFESYVGIPYEHSALQVIYVPPSSASLKAGDRTLTCIVTDPRVDYLTGPLRGSGE